MTIRQNITAIAYDKRGRILSVGKNSYVRTHPLQAMYARRTGNPHKIYIHAEIDALIKARHPIHRMVVTRAIKRGFGCAKPCESCQMALRDFGVKIIEHT